MGEFSKPGSQDSLQARYHLEIAREKYESFVAPMIAALFWRGNGSVSYRSNAMEIASIHPPNRERKKTYICFWKRNILYRELQIHDFESVIPTTCQYCSARDFTLNRKARNIFTWLLQLLRKQQAFAIEILFFCWIQPESLNQSAQ